MRRAIGIICSILVAWGVASAQDDGYNNKVTEIIKASSDAQRFLNSSNIDFDAFDRWYKTFKQISGEFRKDFISSHKGDDSFKLALEALDKLSAVWSTLKQADYSRDQYKESITLDLVDDAHKWRNAEIEQRKQAVEYLIVAMERFSHCRKALNKEQR